MLSLSLDNTQLENILGGIWGEEKNIENQNVENQNVENQNVENQNVEKRSKSKKRYKLKIIE
jgi:hypothetical protein